MYQTQFYLTAERRQRSFRVHGFSLVELLVVIGIIGVLLAILLPVLSTVRKSARDTACLVNLHEWGRSYQMYVDGNKGKSLVERSDVTDLSWYEVLEPFNGPLSKTLLCPDATEPGNSVGSSSQAWGPIRTYSTGNPEWKLRGTYTGSYGLNGWLWRVPNSQTPSAEQQKRMIQLPARNSANVPLFADCILESGLPLDTDEVPTNLEHPLPTSGTGVRGPSGAMAYFCINRHRKAVNAVFLDGHAVRVPLKELWKLEWNRDFKARNVEVR